MQWINPNQQVPADKQIVLIALGDKFAIATYQGIKNFFVIVGWNGERNEVPYSAISHWCSMILPPKKKAWRLNRQTHLETESKRLSAPRKRRRRSK